MQKILFSEILKAANNSWLTRQLIYLKRCFGSRAKIGIVTTPGNVDYCGTVTELVTKGHAPSGSEWIDPFLTAIPSISEVPTKGNFMIIQSLYCYHNNGPPSPWDIAMREQEAARVRAKEYRTHYLREK